MIKYILNNVFKSFIANIRNLKLWSVFIPYLSIHYFIYSLVIERILSWIYEINFDFNNFLISFVTIPLNFLDPLSLLLYFGFSPSVVIIIPPTYLIELSLFSIFIGFFIGMVVSVSVLEILKMRELLKKFRVIIALPTIGVISGGGCCISLPSILVNFLPLSQGLLLTQTGTLLLLTYFLLPMLTLIGLTHNYKLMCKANFKAENTF
jgi:hypothetical protein